MEKTRIRLTDIMELDHEEGRSKNWVIRREMNNVRIGNIIIVNLFQQKEYYPWYRCEEHWLSDEEQNMKSVAVNTPAYKWQMWQFAFLSIAKRIERRLHATIVGIDPDLRRRITLAKYHTSFEGVR